MPQNLVVAQNQTTTISSTTIGTLGGKIIYVRPKTPDALKVLAGLPLANNPVRLSDTHQFEVLANVADLVCIHPDQSGSINGLNSTYVRSIIATISRGMEMPPRIRLVQRRRMQRLVNNQSDIVRVREVLLPDWLRKFKVYHPVIDLNSITIGSKGVLVIDDDVSHMTCKNFSIAKDGKVLIKSKHLNIDIRGELQGNL